MPGPWESYQAPAAAAPAASGPWSDYQPPAQPADKPSGFLSHVASSMAAAPGAIVQTVTHPLDSLKAWRDQSQDLHDKAVASAESGDYAGAAAHGINFLANIVPGLGKGMDDAATAGAEYGMTSPEFRSKLGDLVGPLVLARGAEAAPAVVKGTVKAAAAAPGAIMDFARTPGNLQMAAGGAEVVGGGGAMVAGHPIGGGVAIMRGLENIGRGMDKRTAAAAASKVAADAAPAAAAPVIDPLLDQIAQSTSGKKFSALDAAAQATVQKIADAANKRTAAPAGPAAPTTPPPEAPPQPAAAPAAAEGMQPGTEAPDVNLVAESQARSKVLADARAARNGTAQAPAPAAAPTPMTSPAQAAFQAKPPEVTTIPATESPAATDFAAKARTQRAASNEKVMDALEQSKVSADQFEAAAPNFQKRLSDALGFKITDKALPEIVAGLRAREAARAAAAPPATMQTPSPAYQAVLKANPRALAIAQQLAAQQ
jgi:hypothetical protein